MALQAGSPSAGLPARARQVRPAAVARQAASALDWVLTSILAGIAWVFGGLWFCVVFAVMYVAKPLAWGFRAGAGWPQPDEKKPEAEQGKKP
jgi:hypothetical protein